MSKPKNDLAEIPQATKKIHAAQLFSTNETHEYCIRNVEEVHAQLDQALQEALAEMSFVDANHGHHIMVSVIGFLRKAIPGIKIQDTFLTRERFLIAILTVAMTRRIFEGMVAEQPRGEEPVKKPKRPRTKFKDTTKGKK